MKLAGGKVLAVHRLFARAGELKDGATKIKLSLKPKIGKKGGNLTKSVKN